MRASCKFPDDCTAGARGPCRRCHDVGRQASRMKALHADPEFKAANAARMKALHADPEFKARMKALHADPEFKAAKAARMKALNADPEFKAKLLSARKGCDGVVIPRWVPADLWVEFLDIAAISGEEAAASHIRRLKKEMGAPPRVNDAVASHLSGERAA